MKANYIIFIFLVFILSCKKDASNTNTNSGVQTQQGPYPNAVYGILRYSKQYSTAVSSPILSNLGYRSMVFFTNSVITNNELPTGTIEATQVKLNGTIFKKESGTPFYYWDTSFAVSVTSALPHTWQIIGKGTLPSFIITNYGNHPTYTGWGLLQDSIDMTQNIVVPIQGVTGADEVEVYFSNYGDTSSIKVVPSSASSVTFTSNDFLGLAPTNYGYVVVNCYKNGFGFFNNRTYKLQIGCCTYKSALKIK